MNKKIVSFISSSFQHKVGFNSKISILNNLRRSFSTVQNVEPIVHRFPYGQAGQFNLELINRTYSLSFQTIWQDHAQLSYSGLTGQNSFFIIQKGKQVKIDDLDLQSKQTQYIKMHSKIPEDYTIRGKVNGSIRHIKNSVSSKTRSNSFEIQLLGYKNIYQWLNIECQNIKITNKNGQVDIGNMTVMNADINCQSFKSKKILFSGKVNFKAANKMAVRSIISYQNAMTTIEDSGDVEIQSLSGQISTKNIKSLKIDRLLSSKDGIQIQCQKINSQIIIQTGSGTIQCLKQNKQTLQQTIKLGRMHKGRLDFHIHENINSPFSKVQIYQ